MNRPALHQHYGIGKPGTAEVIIFKSHDGTNAAPTSYTTPWDVTSSGGVYRPGDAPPPLVGTAGGRPPDA